MNFDSEQRIEVVTQRRCCKLNLDFVFGQIQWINWYFQIQEIIIIIWMIGRGQWCQIGQHLICFECNRKKGNITTKIITILISSTVAIWHRMGGKQYCGNWKKLKNEFKRFKWKYSFSNVKSKLYERQVSMTYNRPNKQNIKWSNPQVRLKLKLNNQISKTYWMKNK